ncbi:hypothetical protein CDL12_11884 [Handroanthus impetiginosus]|uniref:F-box domain-containing protein n=1 Tax=Handroanthus impetiginosus TaxID=429701 RepID=A0A2G9HDV0_9LAMI|nr:hypothetical protein CDL12_11884 [Handroanthus impetiginosus]
MAPAFPEEIIKQIFFSLPVKSLLRFKTVSRQWHQLISSRQFAEKQHQIQSQDEKLTIFYGLNDRPNSWTTSSLTNLMYDEDQLHDVQNTGVGLSIIRVPYDSISVVGSCNGLICLSALLSNEVVLWNPALRKHRVLPSLGDQCQQYGSYGFGYDPVEDEYLVVTHITTIKNGEYWTRAKVYSSRTDSWTSIDHDNELGDVYIEESGIFVHEMFHWIGIRMDGTYVVLSLDMMIERYEEILHPDYVEVVDCMRLGVWRGDLSIISSSNETELNVWVMKEYGDCESWTKLFRIPYFHQLSQIGVPRVCFVMENGDVLLNCGPSLVICKLNNGSMWFHRVLRQGGIAEF